MENFALDQHSSFFQRTRKWLPNIELDRHDDRIIRCMSYNVLADSYLDSVDYGDTDIRIKAPFFKYITDPELLKWDNRFKYIQENEIDILKPDIICFQELEDEALTEHLIEKNYCSCYIYKTQNKTDCVSIFWKASTFESVGTWSIELGKDRTKSYLYNKPQVACFAALKVDREVGKQIIIVCTSHILFNNNRGDVKLAQLDLIMKCICEIKNFLQTDYSEYNISVIFGGDFNSCPNSGIYQYMVDGKYNCKTQNRDEISGQHFNSNRTEKAFLESISILKPNPDADVLKLPQWFLEINNTRVYLKTDINSNEPYFLFEPKEKIYHVMNKADKIERVLSRVNYKRRMKQQKLLRLAEQKESGSDSDSLEIVHQDVSDIDSDDKEVLDEYDFILINQAGKFKSAYSKGMKNLKEFLFGDEDNSKYHEILDDLNVDSKTVISNYKNGDYGDVVYGAFKPDLNDETKFDEYWKNNNMELAYSSFTEKLTLVDYIWYQSDQMKVLKVLDIPNYYEDLCMFSICPNEVVPSDHFPLVVDFYFK